MSALKQFVKRSFRTLGFQIRRIPAQYACHLHSFPDQRAILAERAVDVILDVGANIGQSVIRYRWLFPDAVIHSFEPVPEAFEELKRRTADDVNAHVWSLAVSDETGTVRFNSNRMSDTSSLLPTRADHADDIHLGTQAVLDVASTTLDEFCSTHDIRRAAILKLDVQGGEALVLRGARQLLQRQALDLILTEVWFDAPYVGAPHFCEIDTTLRSYGYQLYGLYWGPHQSGNQPVFTADAIYLNRSLLAQLDPQCSRVDPDFAASFIEMFGE
jgi:FkbM family methyltransferase